MTGNRKKGSIRRYAGWLRRRILGRPRSGPNRAALLARLSAGQPLPTFGFDIAELRERFALLSIDGSEPGALAGYARQDLERFLRTVALVPEIEGRALEIGANPYFTTVLLGWLRPNLELSLTNYFGGEPVPSATQTVVIDGDHDREVHQFDYANVNVEEHRLPHDDASFDVVLFCEVLEHMTNDPVATLREISRVLKPGGKLVLTTPNAARLENIGLIVSGLNVADQYSGYGPYGRHNREYTVDEIAALLAHCGFIKEIAYTADVYPNRAGIDAIHPNQLVLIVGERADWLGQYQFTRWRSAGSGEQGRPNWLYRSLPADELSDAVPLSE